MEILFPPKMDSAQNLKNWRLSIRNALFTQPTSIMSLINMLIDSSVDVLLVCMALKTSIPPFWIFFAFLGCQALAAPIHGIISDCFSKRKNLLFSLIMTAIAVKLTMEISKGSPSGSYVDLLGLCSFTASTQMLIILCAKGLLTGTTVICRAAITDCIQMETEKKSISA